MAPWTRSPEAARLLASCAAFPPRRRLFAFRFQEVQERYVGRRARRLRCLYRASEPEPDSEGWHAWLLLDPERAIREAVARHAAAARPRPKEMPKMVEPAEQPIVRHNRLIAAFCEDLASGEFQQSGATPRADAACLDGDPTEALRAGAIQIHPLDQATNLFNCATKRP